MGRRKRQRTSINESPSPEHREHFDVDVDCSYGGGGAGGAAPPGDAEFARQLVAEERRAMFARMRADAAAAAAAAAAQVPPPRPGARGGGLLLPGPGPPLPPGAAAAAAAAAVHPIPAALRQAVMDRARARRIDPRMLALSMMGRDFNGDDYEMLCSLDDAPSGGRHSLATSSSSSSATSSAGLTAAERDKLTAVVLQEDGDACSVCLSGMLRGQKVYVPLLLISAGCWRCRWLLSLIPSPSQVPARLRARLPRQMPRPVGLAQADLSRLRRRHPRPVVSQGHGDNEPARQKAVAAPVSVS